MTGEIVELSPALRASLAPAEEGRAEEWRRLDLASPTRTLALKHGSRALGWCSLWIETASYQGRRTGAVGQFFSDSRPTALALLERAAGIGRARGLEYLLGPLDGDTWHGYRLTTNDYGRSPFFLDRLTPRSWNDWFIEAGFEPVAEYHSTLSSTFEYEDESARRWHERLKDGRLVLRPLNPDRFEEELGLIHELSLASFNRNFMYTPISRERFLALYRPLRDLVVPKLVQLASVDRRPAGFCLCLPDYAQKQAGREIDTLILKTFARRPEEAYRGLGAFLMWHAHRQAAAFGFKHLIVAFMHRDNHSLTLARQTGGEIIRSYALYGRKL